MEHGFQRLSASDLELWWRQRLIVPGEDPIITDRIRPRRLVVGADDGTLTVSAVYA